MPSDSNEPKRPRRDPTGAMIGAAMRAERRRAKPDPNRKRESPFQMVITVLVVIIVLFGMVYLALRYGH